MGHRKVYPPDGKRLAEKPHECEIETMVYAHGTHFVFPEGMLKIMLPVGSGLFVKFAFQAAKKISEGMPTDPDRHRETDVPGVSGMERSKVRCVGRECHGHVAVFARSFQTQLTAVLGYDAATAKQITKAPSRNTKRSSPNCRSLKRPTASN